MATAGERARSPFEWGTDLWNNTSTPNKLVLVGVVAVVLVALLGLGLSSRSVTEGKVAILDGYKFTSDESRAALQAFSTANLTDYEYVGGQILVPKNRVNNYLQALASADAFRDNFDKPIDDYINNQRTWWASQSDAERLMQVAKTKTVGKMISSMSGVEEAVVVYATPDRLSLRRAGRAKASVAVTAYRPLSPSQIEQIKDLVAGAFPDLDRGQVTVAVTNQSQAAVGKDIDTGVIKAKNEYLQTKEAYAEEIERDIRRLLADVDGVEVVANVDLEPQDQIQQTITSFGKGAVSTQETTSRNVETAAALGPAGGEPGVRTNVDLPGTPPAANVGATTAQVPSNTETDDTSNTRFENNRIEVTQKIHGLLPKKVGVVINVPRSYLEPGTNAEGTAVPPARTEQDIIEAVTRLGYPGLTAENVKVLRYTPVPAGAVTSTSSIRIETIWREYGSTILFGLLAILAIVGALLISRRAPLPTLVVPPEDTEAREEEAAESLLPKVPESDTAKKMEKMTSSITDIVGQDAEAAASLVRRWIDQEG